MWIVWKNFNYEFTIIATDGGKIKNKNGLLVDSKDSETFQIKVKNTNRAPVLARIDDQIIRENEAIIDINGKDVSKLSLNLKEARPDNPKKDEDEDIDLQKLTYSCEFKNEGEKTFNSCKEPIRGILFDGNKGILKWISNEYF